MPKKKSPKTKSPKAKSPKTKSPKTKSPKQSPKHKSRTTNERVSMQDDVEAAAELKAKTKPHQKWHPPDSDEEVTVEHYDIAQAWKSLFSLHSCQQIFIEEDAQKNMKILAGVHVTQEFPWKQVPYHIVKEFLFDDMDHGDIYIKAFANFPATHHLLIGYVPSITQDMEEPPEGDPYIIFISPDDARTALNIIRNMEMYERWVMGKRLVKKPGRWITGGSEHEVNLTVQKTYMEPVEVEIQSVYPVKIPENKELSFRFCEDVRDGYVELVPAENAKFDNLQRRCVNAAIQVAPLKVEAIQQTVPTFPTNAWAQYEYEVKDGETALDETSDDEEEAERKALGKPIPRDQKKYKPPPEMSSRVHLLLETLQFNQIDVYRNDYKLITKRRVTHYTTAVLKERISFADISKSANRYVSSTQWYPMISGLIVVSYSFTTPSTVENWLNNTDEVQRAVLQPNPVLMWSFNDNLNFKLEFISDQEVTCLKFFPHNSDLLIAGLKNGQILLWDIQQRAENLDAQEYLTTKQQKNRAVIQEFLVHQIPLREEVVVPPATVSGLEICHKLEVTGIYWLGCRFYINKIGKLFLDPDTEVKHKMFMSCSMDGTISFWDLDSLTSTKGQRRVRDLPRVLLESESVYKGKTLRPAFSIAHCQPITGIVADTTVCYVKVLNPKKIPEGSVNVRTFNTCVDTVNMKQTLITASFYGRIERLNWSGGMMIDSGPEEATVTETFAQVHDGPVVVIKKSPHIPKVFISIGRTVFALWHSDFGYSPIMWRKRDRELTAIDWSKDRPGVFYITRIDGNLEVWDIISRDDDACFNDIIGGGIITSVTEHGPKIPYKVLGVADYNSSLRMIYLPKNFSQPLKNELQKVKEIFRSEVNRKRAILGWEQRYNDENKELIEVKIQAEEEAVKEWERLELEEMLAQNIQKKKPKSEEEDKYAPKVPPAHFPYSMRMKILWDEMNIRRMLAILMTRMKVKREQLAAESALERQALAYKAAKKRSIARTFRRVQRDLQNVRAKLLPAEKVSVNRIELIHQDAVDLLASLDNYDTVTENIREFMEDVELEHIPYSEVFARAEKRRRLMLKDVGGNTERRYFVQCALQENLLEDCNWTYKAYREIEDEEEEEEGKPDETDSVYRYSSIPPSGRPSNESGRQSQRGSQPASQRQSQSQPN